MTSGTVEARRPPNKIAEIGTPAGSSHSGAMIGHWSAGVVKRALGCAAGSLDLDGLELGQADLDLLLTVDGPAWKLEADQIPEFFRGFGEHLPARLRELQQELIDRLG